jgi:cell division protein FtsB
MVVGYTAVRVLQFTESEYKYQLEKQQLIIESLRQEVSYLKEIIKLLRHGD